MYYAYIRVSRDHQNVEHQKFEILTYCQKHNIQIDKWIDEAISSRKPLTERKLGKLLKKLKKGDVLIATELSRLGRNLLEVMGILQNCLEKDCQIWTLKENYHLGSDIQSKVLAFAFGLSAEIEMQLISQRTKEALALRKKEGVKLGRPRGSANTKSKLEGAELAISVMIWAGTNVNQMAKLYGTHRNTVKRFIITKKLDGEDNLRKVKKMVCGIH